MAKVQIINFKQGDDFKLDFTLTDTNNSTAIAALEDQETAAQAVADLEAVDPQDPVAIAAANVVLTDAIAAYEAAIVLPINGWGITSQIRWCGEFIAEFDVDLSLASIGKFALTKAAIDTATWIPRKYDMDIQFSRVTGKVSSETFILHVEKDVTYV